jgi:hypothetical protein
MLEPLEPRVYLSASTGDDPPAASLAADQVRTLVNELFPGGLASSAEVQAFESADSRTRVLLVDVNGNADASPALVAAYDRVTGQLLTSIEVAAGQIALVTRLPADAGVMNSPDGTTAAGATQVPFNLAVVSRGNPANDSPTTGHFTSGTELESVTKSPSGLPTATTREDSITTTSVSNDPAADRNTENTPTTSSPATDPVPASQPVVVLIPSGAQVGTQAPGGNRDAARPLILSHWFAVLSPSPWWGRAVDLPGVQSRVGDLLDRGLDDDYLGSRSRSVLGNGLGDPLSRPEFSSSRVMLRSPAQLLVFSTPATQESGSSGAGAELATYNFATGQLARTGHAVSSRLFPSSGQVAFLSSEVEQGADLSGDGVMNALVLQVFNPVTGGVRNTGVTAERIRADGGQLILGLRDAGRDATASPAQSAAGKLWEYRFDPATGRLTNLLRPYDLAADAATAPNHAKLSSKFDPPIPDAPVTIRTSRPVDPNRNNDLVYGQTIAPIDTPATRPSPIAIDASPRPTGGNPAGPPKPGGSSGTDSTPDSGASASDSSSTSAGASAGGGGSGGE